MLNVETKKKREKNVRLCDEIELTNRFGSSFFFLVVVKTECEQVRALNQKRIIH